MEIVLGTLDLVRRGGTETYSITVAQQLQRLGHDVTIAVEQTGPLAAEVVAGGLRVADGDNALPQRADALLVNDNVSSLRLGARFLEAPQVFVAHSDVYDLQLPPGIPGLVSTIVVLHDRMARHVAALALQPEIVRLRQPIDTAHFAPIGPARPTARRVLALGNYLAGGRLELLERACREVGLELEVAGRHGHEGIRDDVRDAIAAADIVASKGRAALEGMACGRATYVYDHNGCDGWVTPERYPLLEADNFGGQAEPVPGSFERLCNDLRAYRPEMGAMNRELVVVNHDAGKHAQALVGLLRSAAPGPPADRRAFEEMAWLARRMWQAESRAEGEFVEARSARERAEAIQHELATAQHELTTAQHELTGMRADRDALVRQREEFRSTRRYRLAEALGRPADALRARFR